jgi:hypothetical protein
LRRYDKAYPSRNPTTRQEDLLRRFLNGIHNKTARFKIEFVKDPCDIEKAIRHVINFTEAKISTQSGESDVRIGKDNKQTGICI